MKLLIPSIITLSLLSISCKKESTVNNSTQNNSTSSSTQNNSSSLFNPPSWTHGTWRDSTFLSFGQPDFNTFEFTSNNIYNTSSGSVKDLGTIHSNGNSTVEEIKDNTKYHTFITSSIGQTQKMYFVKKTNNTMSYSLHDPAISPVNVHTLIKD